MATPAALPAELCNFLAQCSPEQIYQLIHNIGDAQTASNAASSMTAKSGVTAAKVGKKQRNKKAKSDRATGGPKRPLNSWMAFRKFMHASLAGHTQKTISKVLTKFWQADPFEAKWAMLAKAYSTVRGSGEKEDFPLDGFLKICAPAIGVIPPEEYQQRMGWRLDAAKDDDEDKIPQPTQVFTPDLNTFPEVFRSSSLGVDDLIQLCYDAGYAKAGSDGASGTNASGSLTMAVQPAAIEAARGGENPPLSPSEVEFSRVLLDALSESPAGENTLSNATTAINSAGGIYPYNTAFDPAGPPGGFDISFNPNSHEDGGKWDAFDAAMAGDDNSMDEIDWDAFTTFLGT